MGLDPVIFEFAIGGHTGPSFDLKLVNEQLVCHQEPMDEWAILLAPIAIEGNEHWTNLVAFLATRKWKGVYRNEDILDGTSWNLKVKGDNENIQAGGCNEYPPGFMKFLRLLNKVTGEIGLVIY